MIFHFASCLKKYFSKSNCLPIVICFEEIPNYVNCPGYQNKWYPIEKANPKLIKKAWVFTQLTLKLIWFTDNSLSFSIAIKYAHIQINMFKANFCVLCFICFIKYNASHNNVRTLQSSCFRNSNPDLFWAHPESNL